MALEKLYSIEEVVSSWKTSYDTLLRAIKRGDLEGVKMGKCWKFSEEQLNNYLAKRTVSYSKKKKLILN